MKKFSIILLTLVLVFASMPALASEGAFPMTFNNYGNEITVAERPTKVVTAGPNCTELFIELGLSDLIIGNSCDNHAQAPLPEYAEAYDKIPELTFGYPTLEAVVSSDCDFLYAIDWVFGGDFTIEALEEQGVTVYANSATTVNDLYTEIRDMGIIFGVEEKAEAFIADQQARVKAVQDAIAGEMPKTIFCYDSDTGSGVYTVGGPNIMTQFIEMAGGTNLTKDLEKAWIGVSLEEIADMNPDVIIVNDYDTPTAEEKIAAIKSDPILSQLDAVKNEQFLIVPLEACFPGSRTATCVELIAKGLYPDKF